jgi:Regulator of chromosome condensation (RCC1) repeat
MIQQKLLRFSAPISPKRGVQIAAGGFHAAALTADGEVYTWGRGSHGALGHGGTAKLAIPKRVAALRGVDVAQVCGLARESPVMLRAGFKLCECPEPQTGVIELAAAVSCHCC